MKLENLYRDVARTKSYFATQSSYNRYSRSQNFRKFVADWQHGANIQQPKSMDCWITAITMLYQWRGRQSMSIDAVADRLGEPFKGFYLNNTGLYPSDEAALLRVTGLEGIYGTNFPLTEYGNMLDAYGPLMITIANAGSSSPSWGMHARILVGIEGDGTPAGTKFWFVDPGNGSYYDESGTEFIFKYEREVSEDGTTRHHIVHWPAGVSRQLSVVARQKTSGPAPQAEGDEDIYEDDTEGMQYSQAKSEGSYCPINRASDASTAHFTLAEFNCRDGSVVPENIRGNVQLLMEQLEVLRAEVNRPIRVTSGYRSDAYNRRVGGVAQSRHRCGQAADIQIDGMTPDEVHATILRLIAAGRMRDGGLGLYRVKNFVHYDIHRPRRWSGRGDS